jgi:hypothetical protein
MFLIALFFLNFSFSVQCFVLLTTVLSVHLRFAAFGNPNLFTFSVPDDGDQAVRTKFDIYVFIYIM